MNSNNAVLSESKHQANERCNLSMGNVLGDDLVEDEYSELYAAEYSEDSSDGMQPLIDRRSSNNNTSTTAAVRSDSDNCSDITAEGSGIGLE